MPSRRPPPRPTEATPSAEESALFRAAVKDVRPLRHETAPPLRPRPAPVPRRRRLDEAGARLAEASSAELDYADHLEYRRDGVQPQQWRRLRRGEVAPERTLDLHGHGIDAARAALDGFLVAAVAGGCKCVRIVHGKGYRSADRPPILKPRVAYWLAHAPEVVAYVSARPDDGGTGALYVLLKRRREPATPPR